MPAFTPRAGFPVANQPGSSIRLAAGELRDGLTPRRHWISNKSRASNSKATATTECDGDILRPSRIGPEAVAADFKGGRLGPFVGPTPGVEDGLAARVLGPDLVTLTPRRRSPDGRIGDARVSGPRGTRYRGPPVAPLSVPCGVRTSRIIVDPGLVSGGEVRP